MEPAKKSGSNLAGAALKLGGPRTAGLDAPGPADQRAPKGRSRFDLPQLQMLNVKLDAFLVKVFPSLEVSAEADRIRNLVKGAEPYTFTVANPDYEGVFQVRLLPPRAEVRILTTAQIRDNSCLLVSYFHCRAPLGHPSPLQVLLRNCPGEDVRLELPGPRLSAGHRRIGADYLWELKIPPDAPQPFHLSAFSPHFDQGSIQVGPARGNRSECF